MKTLFTNIEILISLSGVAEKKGRHPVEADLGIVKNAAMLVESGRVMWVGPEKKLPKSFAKKNIKEVDLKHAHVLPGFVECHTHTVFAGSRAAEFEMRNQGVSYQEIAARGGGILSTMNATRAISLSDLKKISQTRVDRFLEQGVTTLEIKSGYGLDLKSELKILEVAKAMKGPQIVTTFLGAHSKPPEFVSYDEYLKFLLAQVLPQVKSKKLSQRVDIFIENGFFSAASGKDFLQKAKMLGFQVTVHADQLSLSGGSDVALQLNALSADHVIQIDESLIKRFAQSETVAVLLPTADLYMKCSYPPARALIDKGARVALATDYNPGTSPTQDLNLVGLLARLEMKMSLPEVIAAYTFNAASSLGIHENYGSLAENKSADFICLQSDWQELFYSVGHSLPSQIYREGRLRHKN